MCLSQRYIPNNVTINALHFMTGASLRLGPGNKCKLELKSTCLMSLDGLRLQKIF